MGERVRHNWYGAIVCASTKEFAADALVKDGSLSTTQAAGCPKSIIRFNLGSDIRVLLVMAWEIWKWHVFFPSLCEVCAESDFSRVFVFLITFVLSRHFTPLLSPPLFFHPPTTHPPFRNFHLTQLKQMKELEQEKDSLLAGLEVVERARDWYQGQIHNVTERQRQVGQSSHCTVSSNTGLKLEMQLCTRCILLFGDVLF